MDLLGITSTTTTTIIIITIIITIITTTREVPFGQLFGDVSFKTLGRIYTGYGEKVSQGKIRNRGNSYIKADFPLLDYMTECHVEASNVPWTYNHHY